MFLILTPRIIQTPLWRTFDGGSPEDSMDDREVDSRYCCVGLEDHSFILSKDQVGSSAWWSWSCASAGSACEEIGKFLVQNWYSSTAMVDEWNASVFSACFRSPLQFNCKLVCYCNIWLSCWTPSFWFSLLYSLVWITDIFASFCGTLTDIGPWSLGRTSGTITVSVCEHCYVHFDDNIWVGLLDYFEKMSVALDFFWKVVIYVFIQLFLTPWVFCWMLLCSWRFGDFAGVEN